MSVAAPEDSAPRNLHDDAAFEANLGPLDSFKAIAPGLLLSALVAGAATLSQPLVAKLFPLPTILLALFLGMLLHGFARRPILQHGLAFCVKHLLRWAVALLGIRIALSDMLALGASTAIVVIVSMASTVACGILLARWLKLHEAFGALAGTATAVCGASAALATATMLPNYRGKEADVVFVAVAVNALSTVAMIVYPLLCVKLGLSETESGIVLGASIHDVAQVVGAGYALSEPTGNTAVVVKLFRVFLLLPLIVLIGRYFAVRNGSRVDANVAVPGFAVVFLLLCLVNTAVSSLGGLPAYDQIKAVLTELSNVGLLIAIAALGLGTSFGATLDIGWRRGVLVVAATIFILCAVILIGAPFWLPA
jgi:uncharacterized integral membrane protein (TIGR00698 family)